MSTPNKINVYKRGKRRQINLPSKEGFVLRQQGSLYLLLPDNKKNWPLNQRKFRSLVFNRSGDVVSCGLPKFFEWQKDQLLAAEAEQALQLKQAYATIKYDGSMALRSVDRGKVLWRTRSALVAEHLAERFQQFAEHHHPILNDPAFLPDTTLVFEYVDPQHRIVIPYPEPKLILIGEVSNKTLQVSRYPDLCQRAKDTDLPVAELLEHECQSLQQLQEKIDQMPHIEGVVLRWEDHMLKVKGADYQLQHRMRYQWPATKLIQIIERKKIISSEQLLAELQLESDAPERERLQQFFAAYQRVNADVEQTVNRLRNQAEQLTSKRQLKEAAQLVGSPQAEALVAVYDGDVDKARQLLQRRWYNEQLS